MDDRDVGTFFVVIPSVQLWPDVIDVSPMWEHGGPVEHRRYVPERTCEVECFDDGVDEALDGEWISYAPPTWYLSCGHTVEGADRPRFCSACGARVKEVSE